MKLDLHTHTTFSDGFFTPEEIVDLAVKKGLDGIAITDHDTTKGIDSAIKRSTVYKDFLVVPGIEFSCEYNDEEVHILGYFIEYKSPELIKLTDKLKTERIKRGYKIISELNNIGLNITIEDVKKFAKDDFVGRPHIANALVMKGLADSIEDAFNKYLIKGKPGYVKRYKLSIADTINLIHRIDGIAVLAHPGLLKVKDIIDYAIDSGIDGIEAIHSKHLKKEIDDYIYMSKRNNLIITGGSDFHGAINNCEYSLGNYYIDIDKLETLKRRRKNDSI
ncbi:PHP domain-containing protein [Anaerosalibacter sp. Marseille-P3206]|uniref:PHP domain-containing protein n=1 Tax=Anaerosalibacter sp. Marseille-P3206 TaxID=1871005 RepID=UPI0009853700|nr:PHP domain-containing protein [Anaerosalibacter sp. Marseille-P3206]